MRLTHKDVSRITFVATEIQDGRTTVNERTFQPIFKGTIERVATVRVRISTALTPIVYRTPSLLPAPEETLSKLWNRRKIVEVKVIACLESVAEPGRMVSRYIARQPSNLRTCSCSPERGRGCLGGRGTGHGGTDRTRSLVGPATRHRHRGS